MVLGKTPLVRLQRVGGGRVALKLETRSPDATMADRLAQALCDKAGYPEGAEVREAGDGALCIALAAQCATRRWKLKVWLPEDTSIEVRQALEHFGVPVTLTPFEGGPHGAKAAARGEGALLSERFPSVRIAVAHELGRELIADVGEGRIDAFVAGAATGATLSGVMSELRHKWPTALGVAVQPAKAPVVDHGIWKPHRQPGIAPGPSVPMLDRTLVARVMDVSDTEAWAMRSRLGAEEGILLSVASAAAVVAAERLADELGDGAEVVALGADTGERDFSLAEQFK
jgi:cysteine synthase A